MTENENIPVLMWYPHPSSMFGLGGEARTPNCSCGAELTWVGLLPFGDAALGMFYCFVCQPSSGNAPIKSRPTKGCGVALWRLELTKAKQVCAHLGPSFVGLRAVAGGMATRSRVGQYPTGVGVYSQGISPIPSPACPECGRACSVVVHIDSMAHEDLQWGDLDNFVVWSCDLHPTSAFFAVVPDNG